MKRRKKVLISAIGSPAGQGVVEGINDLTDYIAIGMDSNSKCPIQNKVDNFYSMPRLSSSNYLKELRDLIDNKNIDILIPTIQPELKMIYKYNQIVSVLNSSQEKVNKVLDKINVYKILDENNLNEFIPEYKLFKQNESISKQIKEMGYPKKNICLKPAKEHGGLTFKLINISNTKKVAKKLAEGSSINWRTPQDIESLIRNNDFSDLMFIENLPGKEYSIDVLAKNGEILIAIPRLREKIVNGIVKRGIVEKNQELINATKKIISIFNLDYFINVQFKYNKKGIPKLIDINPRFCGSQIMSYGAGVNFPYLALKLFYEEKIDIPTPIWGTEMIRYWERKFYGNK